MEIISLQPPFDCASLREVSYPQGWPMRATTTGKLSRTLSCRLGPKGLTESCELPVNLWYNL